MTARNTVPKFLKISKGKLRLIVRCFSVDCTALQTAEICNINRKTADRYFSFFRYVVIHEQLKERADMQMHNGIEIDESYFGPRRVRGKRGRGAGRKIVVLGLLKRNGKVFTHIISRATQAQIMPIIRRTVQSGSDIYTDGWRSYDALAVYGYNHKKVKHAENEFAREDSHINGVESFWSWTKRRLIKFNGVPRDRFGGYMLESEYRFNHRHMLEKELKKRIREYISF